MADDQADDRWTVRGVPKAVREAAAAAADRRKITVGAFLCAAMDRELQAERAPIDLLPPRPADNLSDTANGTADVGLGIVERAVAAAVQLASTEGVPIGFRRRANRLLKDALGKPSPRAPMAERRALALDKPA
jgi:hypothetical protein